jgi:hypothetical protein
MNSSGDSISREWVQRNLQRVRERIGGATAKSGRPAESVALIAVTKYFPGIDMITMLQELGVTHIGESRVLDAERKFKELLAANLQNKKNLDPCSVNWHMIGHLQTNKSEKAVRVFNIIHSIDSVRAAEAINTEVNQLASSPQPALLRQIFLQVNIAKDINKYGLEPTVEDVTALLKICSEFERLNVVGLMTMAPFSENPERTSRPIFKRLRELFEEANARKAYRQPLSELSMGMTQDYWIGIEEGATMVRIGSALYEE